MDDAVISIEQILSTLATKEDLRELSTLMQGLIESQRANTRFLAEQIAWIIERLKING